MEKVIYELDNELYHRGEGYKDYLSSSQLKNYLKSPLLAHLNMTDPAYQTEQTEAMRKGTLFHDAMAFVVNGGTVEDFISTLAVFNAPVNPKTNTPYGTLTNIYKDAYNTFLASVAESGKTVATDADVKFIIEMVSAAYSNSTVRKLIAMGKPDCTAMKGAEISIFDELLTPGGNPMKVKCRADLLTAKKIVDWKSSSSESFNLDNIGKTILDFGYDISAALYQYILYKVTGKFYSFIWVFVSTKDPHDVVVCDAARIAFSSIEDLDTYEQDTESACVFNPGVMRMRSLLQLHAKCIDANEWPSSEVWAEPDDSGLRIFTPELPAWAARNEIKAYF